MNAELYKQSVIRSQPVNCLLKLPFKMYIQVSKLMFSVDEKGRYLHVPVVKQSCVVFFCVFFLVYYILKTDWCISNEDE